MTKKDETRTEDFLAIDPEALATMRERGKGWAVYQNMDMGHPDLGRLQFLQYGEGCTHVTPPSRCPDTHVGSGWRYCYIGLVHLETGTVEPFKCPVCHDGIHPPVEGGRACDCQKGE